MTIFKANEEHLVKNDFSTNQILTKLAFLTLFLTVFINAFLSLL